MKYFNTQAIVVLLLILAAGYVIWYFSTTVAPVGVHVPAKVAPQVAPLPKVSTPAPKGVKTYVQAAKKAMKLPETVIADDDIHVIEATRVAADDHPHTITTLVNVKTGETTTLDRREPSPWLAFKKSGALGLSRDLLQNVNTLYVRQDFVQMKSLYLSGSLSLDSARQTGAKIAVEWRW